MSIEQQIEELRAELQACIDDSERVQIEAELMAARASLMHEEARFEAEMA